MDAILYLVRHTSPDVPDGICYGQTDTDVSADFEMESAIVMNKLAGISVSRTFSSPMKRCKKLAYFISDGVIIDNRLTEMNFGDWEGMTWDSVFSTPEGQRWFSHYSTARCLGGESFMDLIERISGFLSDISKIQGNILVITHAGVIRATTVCLGIVKVNDVFDLKIPLGSILKIAGNRYEFI